MRLRTLIIQREDKFQALALYEGGKISLLPRSFYLLDDLTEYIIHYFNETGNRETRYKIPEIYDTLTAPPTTGKQQARTLVISRRDTNQWSWHFMTDAAVVDHGNSFANLHDVWADVFEIIDNSGGVK